MSATGEQAWSRCVKGRIHQNSSHWKASASGGRMGQNLSPRLAEMCQKSSDCWTKMGSNPSHDRTKLELYNVVHPVNFLAFTASSASPGKLSCIYCFQCFLLLLPPASIVVPFEEF
ncbi:hypothetical protein RJT34_16557 [Clitoria ternatea]|uniref:Uncharacterized protein n=1 Tax=Clitoria ternatea TaxID=43366 RepID=A0AAN9J8J8_CLITE